MAGFRASTSCSLRKGYFILSASAFEIPGRLADGLSRYEPYRVYGVFAQAAPMARLCVVIRELGDVLLHYVPDFLARRREIERPTGHQRRDSLKRPLGQHAVASREDAQPVDVVLV